jgi:hypothetical protein
MFRKNVYSNPTSASTSKDLALVELKNKTTVPKSLVIVTMMSLKALLQKNPIAFYELVQKCRNSKHEMFGNTLEVATKLGLIIHDGRIHEYTKNIILSAVSGDGLDMSLGSPISEDLSLVNEDKQEQETIKFGIKSRL